jgi:hypothetical protein
MLVGATGYDDSGQGVGGGGGVDGPTVTTNETRGGRAGAWGPSVGVVESAEQR